VFKKRARVTRPNSERPRFVKQLAVHVARAPEAVPDVHPTLTHVVQVNESLWDLSLRYGVTMKSIRAVNGMIPLTSIIIPGECLSLPIDAADKRQVSAPFQFRQDVPVHAESKKTWMGFSSGKKEESEVEESLSSESAPPPAQGRSAKPAIKLWTDSDTKIRHTATEELEQIMLAQGTPSAQKDTLLVAYTGNCKHCKAIEGLVCDACTYHRCLDRIYLCYLRKIIWQHLSNHMGYTN
jgi:LysM repeat protein